MTANGSPPPRLGLSAFWRGYDRRRTLRAVELADEAGYDSFWVPEAWGYDAFGLLTEMAHRTRRIRLGTAVVNVFSRSPAVLAMSAATIDEISEGRFILGLGTSGARVVEGLHGRPYVRPLRALRDAVRVIRSLLQGERVGAFALAMTPARARIPIFCGCLHPRAIELVGELADGWMPMLWPHTRLDVGLEHLARGARRAGRPDSAVTVAPFLPVIPTTEATGVEEGRRLLTFYLGAMGDHYSAALSRLGFADAVERVRVLWAQRRLREAAATIPPETLDALAVVGSLAHCKAELARRCASGIDLPILNLPLGRGADGADAYVTMFAPARWETERREGTPAAR